MNAESEVCTCQIVVACNFYAITLRRRRRRRWLCWTFYSNWEMEQSSGGRWQPHLIKIDSSINKKIWTLIVFLNTKHTNSTLSWQLVTKTNLNLVWTSKCLLKLLTLHQNSKEKNENSKKTRGTIRTSKRYHLVAEFWKPYAHWPNKEPDSP